MMKTYLKRWDKVPSYYIKGLSIGLLMFLTNPLCFADIILHGNQIITTPTTYNNVTLDLTDGRFTVNLGGSLNIQNSTIKTTISPTNSFFVMLNSGSLTLNNNTVNVKVDGITPNPNTKSSYLLMNIQNGMVNLTKNTFSVDTPFTVELLETSGILTNGFNITDNNINYFHGGLFLINSNNAMINDNIFSNVSFSNIYTSGNLNHFYRNLFSFPGNLKLGNAFDVVNSDSLTIADNIIASGSNYGISIMGAQNVFIDNNKITDGQSYAIRIQTPSLTEIKKNNFLPPLFASKKFKFIPNNNIVIKNNYIAQNKYGLTGENINNLIVTNNIFIQRFAYGSIRQYWTNNDNLLSSITNLTWLDNQYKEAFTQDISGDNTPSLQFVNFPAHGGVILP